MEPQRRLPIPTCAPQPPLFVVDEMQFLLGSPDTKQTVVDAVADLWRRGRKTAPTCDQLAEATTGGRPRPFKLAPQFATLDELTAWMAR